MLLLVLACARPQAPAATRGDIHEVTTASGRYHIVWTSEPAPIPLAQLFEMHMTVTDAKTGAPVEDGIVTVDATMPAHGHGMPTRPEHDRGTCVPAADGATSGDPLGEAICTHAGGVYVTRGMKLHMPGEWVLSFQVNTPTGGDGIDVRHVQ
jgi:hypothetical protein